MHDAGEPLRLLLVEDSEFDAELLLARLEEDGLRFTARRVDTEADCAEALAGFAPGVIISDLAMPEFSGYRALELAQERAPGVPFLFVSGAMGEEAAIDALRRGATDYVLKHNLARLPSAVRRALKEADERQARQQAEAELLRVQRYESLALLASGLSHDLRNVLQPIAMGVSMLRVAADDEVRRIGALIEESTQRGLDIVASMLSFARGSRAAAHRLQVGAVLDGLAMLLRGSLPRNVELVIEPPPPATEIEGNATELQQALLNFCLNGAQAMPGGGTLRISTQECPLDAAFFVRDEPVRPGRYLRISVSDTGHGMSAAVRERLFTAFFTTKENGTGLGLMSCRRIIANHGGVIRVDSSPGAGSTFSAYLPLPVAVATVPARTASFGSGHGERVLIVIERESKLIMLRDLVEAHGYRVSAVDNGALALQAIERDGLPDIVLMDARMSLMTGVRTASRLVEMDYRGPLVLIAGPERSSLQGDLPPLPRIRFIDRPVDPHELLRVLAEESALAQA